MAEDFTQADVIQLAAVIAEGEDCPEEGGDAEACAAGGGVAGEVQAQAQDAVMVFQPPNGGEIILQAVAGQVYDLQFDPRLAQVQVIDADGDGDLDVVLVFNAGTANESRIVFKDMVAVAQGGNPPLLQIAQEQFGADTMVQQAQALAASQPTLETTAAAGPEAIGTGATQYDDNLGTLIELLQPQSVIPPVEMTFPSIDPEVIDPESDEASLTGLLVVGSNEDDQEGQQALHTVPNPGESESGPILGSDGGDILIGDPGGAIVGDLNVAIIIDISGSMVDPDNNPAPDVTRLDVIQDALEEILPLLAARDATVNLFIETFSTDADEPLFIGELTADNVNAIIASIFALDSEAGGFTNYEAPLVDMRDWYLGQLAATDGFTNVAFFASDGFPNRWLDDAGVVQGSGGGFSATALAQAVAAIADLLDQSSGIFSGGDEVLLNAIGMSNALASTLDQLDNTGGAQIVDLGDPSTVADALSVSGVNVGSDTIIGGDDGDIIFGDVPNTDALALAESISLLPTSGWFVFEALEAGQGAVTPGWTRADTIAYLSDPANWAELIGGGRGEGDIIDACAGDDVIFGQGGDDDLTGGSGGDTFVYTLSANEGNDEIRDFSASEGDVLSFLDVVDGGDADADIDIDDAVASFVNGGGAGAVDILTLTSGTVLMIADVDGVLNSLADVDANSLINSV